MKDVLNAETPEPSRPGRLDRPWEYASAAEEIEVLRAELERLREENETWRKQYAIAIEKDERADRIEEAAREVIRQSTPGTDDEWAGNILRAALEEKK